MATSMAEVEAQELRVRPEWRESPGDVLVQALPGGKGEKYTRFQF